MRFRSTVKRPTAWFIAAAIAAMVWSVGGLYLIWFDEPVWPAPPVEDPSAHVRIGVPLTSRLLIVIHDSLNRAAGEDRTVTPFLAETGARGVRGVLTVPGPTLTGISLTAFGTGVTPPLRAAFTNFRLDRWPDEDFVGLAGKVRPLATAYFGDVTWSRLFGPATLAETTYLSDSLVVEWKDGLAVKDREAMAAALAVAPRPEWNLMVVHLTSTDKLAHNHHGRPREADSRESDYGRGARLQDAFARELLRESGPERTTIFLLSDHGCTPGGAHGSFDPVTRETPWAAAGPGIRDIAGRVDLDATALAPLWCRLFGARGPRRAESRVPVDVLVLEPDESVRTHDVNFGARFRAARAFLEDGGHGVLDPKDEESARLGAWADLDSDRPEAASARLAAAEDLVRCAVAEAAAGERRWRFVIGLGGAALCAVGLLAWAASGGGCRYVRGAGLTVLALLGLWLAEAGRDLWVYAIMSGARGSWGIFGDIPRSVVPGVAFGGAAILAKMLGRRVETVPAEAPGAGVVAAACVLVLGGHLAVAWPYGPRVETAFALLFAAAGWLAGRASDPGSSKKRWTKAVALLAALAAAGFVEWLTGRWITADREAMFRVPDADGLRRLALGAFLVHAAWTWTSAREGTGRHVQAAAFGLLGAGLVIYGLADAARATGMAGFAAAAFVAFVAGCAWWIAVAPRLRPDGVFGLTLLSLAIYRVFAGDANFILAAILAAAARGLFYSLRPLAPPAAVVLAVLLEWSWWLAQGYAYKLTAFDPTPAFLLVRDRLDPVFGIPLPVIQHGLPWVWVLGPAAAAVAAGGTSRPLPRMASMVALAFALRALMTLLIVPWFEDEAWYFLTASHYLVFESGRGVLLLIALSAVAAECRGPAGVRVGAA